MANPKILFVAESVTLAHLTRPLLLAQGLPQGKYELHFASPNRFEFAFQGVAVRRHRLDSVSSEHFLRSIDHGVIPYDLRTLNTYIKNEMELFQALKPDLIVGDFRLSLSISAKKLKIPYVMITNAYWSPFRVEKKLPLPEMPVTKWLGAERAEKLLWPFMPVAFAYNTLALNLLRVKHGLSWLGGPPEVFTHGDYTAYADVPELTPTQDLPPHHTYLGPILWSPKLDLPEWWKNLDPKKPIVYLTLGSSGEIGTLPVLFEALGQLPVSVVMATAGRIPSQPFPKNFFVAEYLPGPQVLKSAALLICNGGSGQSYQALQEGVPVLGIATNIDQFLCMRGIVRKGAGILIRSGQLAAETLRQAVLELADNPRYRRGAQEVAQIFGQYQACQRFHTLIENIFKDR